MNARRVVSGLVTGLVWTAAGLFLAVAAVTAVFYFSKALNRDSARDIWGVLRGEKVAVSPADRDRLARFDEKAAAKSRIEKDEEESAQVANDEIQERRERLEAWLMRERSALKLFSDQLAAREARLKVDGQMLADGQKQLADDQKTFREQQDATNLRKVLKLYAGMDAEIVAADFEARLRNNADHGKEEVVEILRRMPERQASEVLSAIESPDTRNSLMAALRGIVGGPGAAAGKDGGQAMNAGGGR